MNHDPLDIIYCSLNSHFQERRRGDAKKLGKTQLQRFAILCDLLIVQIVLDAGGLGGQLLDQEFCPFEGNLKRSF